MILIPFEDGRHFPRCIGWGRRYWRFSWMVKRQASMCLLFGTSTCRQVRNSINSIQLFTWRKIKKSTQNPSSKYVSETRVVQMGYVRKCQKNDSSSKMSVKWFEFKNASKIIRVQKCQKNPSAKMSGTSHDIKWPKLVILVRESLLTFLSRKFLFLTFLVLEFSFLTFLFWHFCWGHWGFWHFKPDIAVRGFQNFLTFFERQIVCHSPSVFSG